MNRRKKVVTGLKDYWAENKNVVIGWTIFALSATVIIQRIGLNQHNEFLKAVSLYDDFYDSDF